MYANRGRRLVFVSSIWRNKKVPFEISLSRGAVARRGRGRRRGELTLYCVFTYFHRIPSTFHKIQRLYKGRRSQDASSTLYTFEFPRQRFPTPTPWQAVRVELEWRRALAPPFIPPRIGSRIPCRGREKKNSRSKFTFYRPPPSGEE